MTRWIGAIGAAVAVWAALLAMPRAAWAWGMEGHRAIALIADRVLQQNDPAVRAKLLAILATDKESRLKTDIATQATWADVLRERSQEARAATSAWHATRLRPGTPDLAAACHGRKGLPSGYPASRGPREACSIDKLEQFIAELKNPETNSFQRLAALQFVLNLVGDANDPLLAIDRGDQGGECVAVQIGNKPSVRLSTWWENTLVRQALGGDAVGGAGRLLAGLPPEAAKWSAGNPEAWVYEAHEAAKSTTYAFGTDKPGEKYEFPAAREQQPACPSAQLYRVSPEYEAKAAAVVRTQLVKAGMRLAAVLRGSIR